MLRAFRTLYGSGRFVINAYQFGAGNAEAIASGAFWFYYRLGFRPASAQARRLAAREAQRMAADRKYRSDARTLKSLAVGDLHLDLPGFAEDDHFDEALLPRVGALAARTLAREPVWSRARAARRIAERLAARPRDRRLRALVAARAARVRIPGARRGRPARVAGMAGGRPRGARRDAAGEGRAAGTRLRAQGAARAAVLSRDARRAACAPGDRRPPALNARARRLRPSPQPSPRVAGRGGPSGRCPRQASDDETICSLSPRRGGESGVSPSMLGAARAAIACKRWRALQGRVGVRGARTTKKGAGSRLPAPCPTACCANVTPRRPRSPTMPARPRRPPRPAPRRS